MIFIQTSLNSSPGSVTPGQTGTLRLGLTTDQSPSEMAQIQYQIVSPPGVVFVSTNSAVLPDGAQVFSTGSTVSTTFALRGSAGLVNIRASVTPSVPPATSATAVALTSAPTPAGVSRGVPVAAAPASRAVSPSPRRKAARKKAAAKTTSKKAASGKKATPRKKPARKRTVARKKPVSKKRARSKGSTSKRK